MVKEDAEVVIIFIFAILQKKFPTPLDRESINRITELLD